MPRPLHIDRPFLWALSGVFLFGMMMLLSASGPLAYAQFGDSWYYFKHQLLYGVVPGLFLFAVVSRIDYRKYKPLAAYGLMASIALLMLVYIPGIGLHLGGSGRWVKIGPINFQPSEFVKITFLLYVAAWLSSHHETKAKTLDEGLIPFLCALGVVVVLLVLQPNTGSTMVIASSAIAMYFISGAPITWFAAMLFGGVGMVALLIKLTPYRAARFMTFLHPELDPQGIGYQINQAYLAIGSGGLFGVGYGHSRQKYLYLPEVAGDSIFAVIGEEMGFVLTLAFLAAFGYLVSRCFYIAKHAPDDFGRFLATGIGTWVAVQALLNISSMLGLMPITGVTLPFISYGASAFIALAIGMGLMASISRQSR